MYAFLTQNDQKQIEKKYIFKATNENGDSILIVVVTNGIYVINKTKSTYEYYEGASVTFNEDLGMIVVTLSDNTQLMYNPVNYSNYDFTNTTAIDYYVDKLNRVWVKVVVPANGETTIWLTTQEVQAPTLNVFSYGENFTTQPKGTLSGSATYDDVGDQIKLVDGANQDGSYQLPTTFSSPLTVEMVVYNSSIAGSLKVKVANYEATYDYGNGKIVVTDGTNSQEVSITYQTQTTNYEVDFKSDGVTAVYADGGSVTLSESVEFTDQTVTIEATTAAVANSIYLKELFVLSDGEKFQTTAVMASDNTYFIQVKNTSDVDKTYYVVVENPFNVSQLWVTTDQPSITTGDFYGATPNELVDYFSVVGGSSLVGTESGVYITLPISSSDFVNFLPDIVGYDLSNSMFGYRVNLYPKGNGSFMKLPPYLCVVKQKSRTLSCELKGKLSDNLHVIWQITDTFYDPSEFVEITLTPIMFDMSKLQEYSIDESQINYTMEFRSALILIHLPFDKPYKLVNVDQYGVIQGPDGFYYVLPTNSVTTLEFDFSQVEYPTTCYYAPNLYPCQVTGVSVDSAETTVGVIVDGKPLPVVDYYVENTSQSSYVFGYGDKFRPGFYKQLVVYTNVDISVIQYILNNQVHDIVVDGVQYKGELNSYVLHRGTNIHELKFTIWEV